MSDFAPDQRSVVFGATTSASRPCAECGEPVNDRGPRAVYCSRKCNRRVANRNWHSKQDARTTAPCAVDGCERNSRSKGLCHKHYEHQRIHGTVVPAVIVGDQEARLLSKVDKSGPVPEHNNHLGPCWIWTGPSNPKTGYGHFRRVGIPGCLAHRAAYELLVGPIPDGLQIDHLCMVKKCVNPDHLEPVTAQENTRRARAARTTAEAS